MHKLDKSTHFLYNKIMKTENFYKDNIDLEYRRFHKKICKTKYNILGIKLPKLRNYAKRLLTIYEIDEILNSIDNSSYENVLVKGLCIAYSKNLNTLDYLDKYIPLIDNWAICDSVVNTLKIFKKDQDKYLYFIEKHLNSNNEFEIRFSLVILLNYYINDSYKDYLYNVLDNVNTSYYYTYMAASWLLSYLFIYYYLDTIKYLQINKLDNKTICKGITKTIESHRITKNQKDNLKKIRQILNEKKLKKL